MNEADLQVENTIQELFEKALPDDSSSIEEFIKLTTLTGQNTILELLAAIQPGEGGDLQT